MELLNQAGVPHKLFDELSRLIERFSQVDRDGIILGLTTNVSFTFICWGPLQLHIVRIFRENSLWAKVAPRVFSLF